MSSRSAAGPRSVVVSIWSYLYGPDGSAAAERDESRWQGWLTTHTPTPH